MRTLVACVALLGAISVYGQAAEYKRGDEVRVQTADGQPASPPIQRVMALPGDRVEINATRLLVNQQAIPGISGELLSECAGWHLTVPAGHYFLVGEQLQGRSASRSCSLIPASRVLGAVQP